MKPVSMKKAKLGSVLVALVTVVIGIVLVAHPGNALISIFRILGIALMLAGIIGVISYFRHKDEKNLYNLLFAVIEIIVSVVILAHKEFAISVYPVIVGILLILDGIGNLLDAFTMKKSNQASWKLAVVLAVITLIIGLVILFNPFVTVEVLVAITGIALIYEGVVNLLIGLKQN